MADLRIENLQQRFGGFTAVDGIDFVARDGEFVTLLGPSGCGKSTTLWMIAGLDQPVGGRISIGDEVIVDPDNRINIPAEERNFGLVFQSYALWPHMTVRQNLEFPLKLRKIGRKACDERVSEALSLVELEKQGEKFPFQLSGGQQQRVALARTIVYRPRLLLLDEPLSNLDAKLRERARTWLRELQQRLGVTTLYVTHDQEEALAMSDRILVMRDGKIVQNAAPQEIYGSPSSFWVADFIGSSNLLEGRADADSLGVALAGGGHLSTVLPRGIGRNAQVIASFRPERARLLSADAIGNVSDQLFQGVVRAVSYLGSTYEVSVETREGMLRVHSSSAPADRDTQVAVPADAWMIFPATTKEEIRV